MLENFRQNAIEALTQRKIRKSAKEMARATPTIREGILSTQEAGQAHSIAVGSEQWFTWLQQETSTSFTFQACDGSYSARKERVGNGRGGWYWKAYRRYQGTLYHAYLGKTRELTLARLNEVAHTLGTRVQERVVATQGKPTVETINQVQWQDEEGVTPLLVSKLHPPRLPAQLIERKHLLVQLDRCYEYKLTVVQAPAGSGKTTLANQWLTMRAMPCAWVSLDANDNDVLRFWRSLLAACQQLLTGEQKAGAQAVMALLSSAHAPFDQALLQLALTRLLNTMSEATLSGLLVLDDYHTINEPSIHQMLAFFIDHLPIGMHVLLLSRSEPPLPLLRWRAAGHLCELHTGELRFSLEESAAFLEQALPIAISRAALLRLNDQLEGWAAGLRLLSLTFSSWRNSQTIEQALFALNEHTDPSVAQRTLFDYFVSEILERQAEPLQRFLLQSSVLGKLCAPLCDAVMGTRDSAQQLAIIQRSGLFLETLEGPGAWYRYHALFSEAMRSEASHQLGEDVLAALSQRASHWYEQQGMLIEAIEAARLTHDMERVAQLIELVNEQDYSQAYALRRWLEGLPEEVLREHPMLCHLLAVELRFPPEIRFVQAESATGEPAPLLENERTRIEELLHMAEEGWRKQNLLPFLAATHGFRMLDDLLNQEPFFVVVEHARRVLDLIPLEGALDRRLQMYRGACLFYLGIDKLRFGLVDEAQRLLELALKDSSNPGNRYLTTDIHALLGGCHLLQGELQLASTELGQVLADARELHDNELIGEALLELAWLAFEWNDLASAQRQADEALEIARGFLPYIPELCERARLQLALVQHVRGESETALQLLTDLWTNSQREWTPRSLWLRARVRTWQGRLLIVTGDLQTLQGSLSAPAICDESREDAEYLEQPQISLSAHESAPIILTADGQLTTTDRFFDEVLSEEILRGRLWLARGRTGAAQRQFARLLSIAQDRLHFSTVLELQLLLAMAYAGSHQQQQAHYWLRQSLLQAVHKGYVRLFLNEGRQLFSLLRSLLPGIQHDSALHAYALFILRAAAQESHATRPGRNGQLTEPLSIQEQRVLKLLIAGWNNQEIAHELTISVNTVKYHIKHLYQKLGVSNRLQASMLARDLSLDESL